MRLLFQRALQKETALCPRWPAKQNQTKWSYTTARVLAWSPTPYCPPLTDPLSQTRVRPLSPESEACVRADVRIPPAASQLCLRYRDNSNLSYGLLHPPSECVCVLLWVCTVCVWWLWWWGSQLFVPSWVLNSSWRVSEPHSHVKLCHPHSPPRLRIHSIFNEIQVSGSSTKGSDRLKKWSKSTPAAARKLDSTELEFRFISLAALVSCNLCSSVTLKLHLLVD